MTRPDRLDVFYGDVRVGSLYDTVPLTFEYDPAWLKRDEAMPVAAIALQPGRQASDAVQAFFENLLPEGELRQYLAQKKHASTLYALLREVAGDTAGGFVLVPGGERPVPGSYIPTTWEALAALLRSKAIAAIDVAGEGARISLAGAQDKASLALFDDGVPRLPQGTAPSTHILKPNIKRLAKVWHSAANEAITMLIAARCGLPTAEVFYEPHTQSCVVRRFDRVLRADGEVDRLVQYDLCQLAGTVSDRKYEKEGGPGIVACAELLRRHSAQPAVDLRSFVDWIFFNLYVGNNDSHAKNLSMLSLPGGGLILAPFYDLMCTRLYPGLSPEFAFAIGGESLPGAVAAAHVVALAGQMRMRPQFLLQRAESVAVKMPDAVDAAVQACWPVLSPGARALAERLRKFVVSTTKRIALRLVE